MAQSAQHATTARMVSGLSLGDSLLFGQNLGAFTSSEQIEKKKEFRSVLVQL